LRPRAALRAQPQNFNRISLHAEAAWQRLAQLNWFQIRVIDVDDRLAPGAHQMMMRAVVAINSKRPVVNADFTKDSRIEKCVDGLVDRRQRDCRNLLSDPLEDFFRTGMARHCHQRLKDDLPLVGHRPAMLVA